MTPSVASEIQAMMEQVTQNPAGTAYATANPTVVGGSDRREDGYRAERHQQLRTR